MEGNKAMKPAITRDTIWVTFLTILCIACFPCNPLVLTGVLEVESYTVLNIIGGVVFVFGMVLVMAPIIMFPRRGGVARGKSFVHTTKLVNTGIYAVVRHPQYTGGIYAIHDNIAIVSALTVCRAGHSGRNVYVPELQRGRQETRPAVW
jgi:protein-S-isoprenylcysteine O-methyltransferase Ste14